MAALLDESGAELLDELAADGIYDEAGPGVPQEYPLQPASHTGLGAVMVTPVNGDTAVPVPRAGLLLSAGSEPVTVTLPDPLFDDALTAGPRVVTVTAGGWWVVPLPPAVYGYAPVTIGYAGDTTEALVAYVYIS